MGTKKTVSIIIDQTRWGFSIKNETAFSMNIQLDDDECSACTSSSNIVNIEDVIDNPANTKGSYFTMSTDKCVATPVNIKNISGAGQYCISYTGLDKNTYYASPSIITSNASPNAFLNFQMIFYNTSGVKQATFNYEPSGKNELWESETYTFALEYDPTESIYYIYFYK